MKIYDAIEVDKKTTKKIKIIIKFKIINEYE